MTVQLQTATPASLPMYDWPEIRDATDAFWAGLARHLGVSGALHRQAPHDALWHQPDMFLSQTCGYPLTHEFKGLLKYVATPHYDADGCEGAKYSSIIFARAGTSLPFPQGACPAMNATDSMSGMLALKLVFAKQWRVPGYFTAPLITGSHLASLAAVQENRADVCAIDSVCVALARRYRPAALEGLVEIDRSPLVPGLPFVTRAGEEPTLRRGVEAAFADPTLAEARAALLLKNVSVLTHGAYDQILRLEASL